MTIWQADFYYLPELKDTERLWELTICIPINFSQNKNNRFSKYQINTVQCTNSQANSKWLAEKIQELSQGKLPEKIQVFRPQALGLITAAAQKLNIIVEATRNTPNLKQALEEKYKNKYPAHNPIKLEKTVPQPLPESLWGDKWQIANIKANQIVELFRDRPLPICHLPETLYPVNLNLASEILIPGIVVYGGKKSMQIARWIEEKKPAFLKYIPTEIGKSGGFILETGLVDRWVFNTFESPETAEIARNYEQKKQAAKGLHFILIQPDDSGMTYTAFWLLK